MSIAQERNEVSVRHWRRSPALMMRQCGARRYRSLRLDCPPDSWYLRGSGGNEHEGQVSRLGRCWPSRVRERHLR